MRRELVYGVLVLALLAGAAIAGYALRDGAARSAEAALTRTAEEARAKLEQVTTASAETERGLRADLARLAASHPGLAPQVEAARRAAPSARPVRVAETRGEFVAAGPPREETGGGCPSAGGVPPQSAGADGLRTAPEAPAPSCLLAAGDRAEIRVAEADLVSDAGTHLVIGTGNLWRLSPGTPALIGTAPLRGEVRVEETATRATPRWAASADVGLSPDGWVYAGAVERRVVGPVWLGLAGGAVGPHGYVAGRLRVEWGR